MLTYVKLDETRLIVRDNLTDIAAAISNLDENTSIEVKLATAYKAELMRLNTNNILSEKAISLYTLDCKHQPLNKHLTVTYPLNILSNLEIFSKMCVVGIRKTRFGLPTMIANVSNYWQDKRIKNLLTGASKQSAKILTIFKSIFKNVNQIIDEDEEFL